jgi:DNA-binding NarL/FixJ family response regulator
MMLKDTTSLRAADFAELQGARGIDGSLHGDCSDEAVQRLCDQQRKAAQMLSCLTIRERQVMQLVTSGLPNKTVAHQLQLSVKTVEKHRGRLMKKLRLHGMCELFRFWFVLTWDELLQTERLGR